jgi:hypothetical protein
MRERRQRNPEQYLVAQQRQRVAKRDADPEKFYSEKRASHKDWRDANPEKIVAQRQKTSRLYRYGMTDEEYARRVQEQGGVCRICKKAPKNRLQVDHDHATNKIRGLLCVNCNRGLGYLRDNPIILDAAAQYLRENGGGYGCEGAEPSI